MTEAILTRANRIKIRWPMVLLLATILLFVMVPTTAYAWPWDSDDKEALDFLLKYQDYLQFTKGGFGSIVMQTFSWGIIRFAYWISKTIEGLIPQALSLFSFVESAGLNKVYQSVLNTVVVGLMVLSLVIIGYKMVTGKGTLDLKSVGMNVVMSVALILLMPTMISSGITFAKTFYNDATSINNQDGGVAWSLIEDGVTDLVYINKNDAYNRMGKEGQKKNALKEKDFFTYDFSEVITTDTAKELEADNPKAEYLKMKLTPDGDGNMQAVKIDDGWMAIFSDSFKGGYYRYTKNTFALTLGLIALAIAYVFSAFIIITAILELAFKRVLGVLVFATDLETGQRSKQVLSDILQCYLTVGFQGFGLSMFAMFVNYLGTGSGSSVNPFIKAVAYVCAVIVLIKGSGTVMRYFGVDIGLKEGYGQLASAFGMGAMLFRKGTGGMNRSKGGKNSGGNDQAEGEERKPERNFGQSLSQKANKTGKTLGYARERGLSGLASDGATMASERATKPFKSMRDMANDTKNKFKEGLDDGTVSAINKNSKPIVAKNKEDETGKYADSMPTRLSDRKDGAKVENADRIMSSSERMREAMKNNAESNINPASAIQQKVKQDIEERKNAMHGQAKSAEELINQKRQEAKYTPEAMNREEMLRKRVEGRTGANMDEKEALTKERIQEAKNSNTGLEKSVKENLQNSTSSQDRRSVDVRENLQNTTSSQNGNRTVDVRENVQSSGTSQPRTVDVRENLQNTTSSQNGNRTVDVRENVQSSASNQPRTVEVRETRAEASQGDKTQKINIIEERKERPNEKVIVEQEVKEKKRPRFTYENNPLFQDISDKPNPLFDNLFKNKK